MTFNFSIPKRRTVWEVLCKVSQWVDEKFFPDVCDVLDPMPKDLAKRQAMIERSANSIREAIANCKSLRQCYQCVDRVRNFQLLHSERTNSKNQMPSCDAQVTGWVASLGLDLKNKQEEIMAKLGNSK